MRAQQIRARAAAARALRIFPDPVGPALARELLTWAEFGEPLGGHKLMCALADDVLRRPVDSGTPGEGRAA